MSYAPPFSTYSSNKRVVVVVVVVVWFCL